MRDAWPPRLAIDGQPDLEGVLRGEVVEPQSRQQADHAVGHEASGFRELVSLGERGAGTLVESATHAFDDSLLSQAPDLSS